MLFVLFFLFFAFSFLYCSSLFHCYLFHPPQFFPFYSVLFPPFFSILSHFSFSFLFSFSPFFLMLSFLPQQLSATFSYFLNIMIDYVNSKLIKYVVAISTSNYELIGKKILEDVFTHNTCMLIRLYEAWLSEKRFIINVWMNIENLNILYAC